MWSRGELETGFDSYKAGSGSTSPGWVSGCDLAWQVGSVSSTTGGIGNRGRRHSAASDSGDTGICTSCSDSVEDHSSSSGTLCFQPLRPQGSIPTAHVMPSPCSNKLGGASSQPPTPAESPLDMKDPRPVRRWSSLTRLVGASDKGIACSGHGSLDRGLLFGSRGGGSMEQLRGAEPRYRYDLGSRTESLLASPLKPSSLDLTFSALPESKQPVAALLAHGQRGVGGSPIQPSVRTQMWLSEQMEYRPAPDLSSNSVWEQRERLRQEAELSQMLGSASLNTMVKIKEDLLRQRELEISRQKQQILQLHARIKENELRVQQVLQSPRGRSSNTYLSKAKESGCESALQSSVIPNGSPTLCCENGELSRRLASAELELLHINDFLKQNTQKYTEDVKKLEEKIKTRDRYISSLKKKCQREAEHNQEKQQRIETLEKYLADLPSLDEVQKQAQQLEEVQEKERTLQERVTQLEHGLAESRTQLEEKEALIQNQSHREEELLASVHSLQEKVEKCLEDGVRLPMLDVKQLEKDNANMQEQLMLSTKLSDNQKKQIEKLSLELAAAEKRLMKEKRLSQDLRDQLQQKDESLQSLSTSVEQNQRSAEQVGQQAEMDSLLEEMSLCLLDLKALCSILTQRARGQEPNLALLLGIKSMNGPAEENEKPALESGLQDRLAQVSKLRKDIDELRTLISDRYAQDMGDNCITQ